jgi:hypothetical protein
MIVFRVERVDKVGPYTIGPGTEAQADRYDRLGERHPLPEEDSGLKGFIIQDDHHFGFSSMEQLESWWPKGNWDIFAVYNNKEKNKDRIYGISEYQVPPEHVEIGDKQLVFRMSESERLTHTPFVSAKVSS